MGRKLDALLGRGFKTSKLKTAINRAISRLAILKNHRHARFSIAHSDLIQLLRLNHHQKALLRVEQVIKDQNMLVVYDMIHDYCNLIKQRINLIEKEIGCPEELKEAVSSLIYAAPRCGEFPELQEIRGILTARYGKEVADSAFELRSDSGVGKKMIQKLSSRELSLESRMMTLTGIAREAGIVLQLEAVLPEKVEKVLSLSESMKYRNVEHTARDAFQSARSELPNSDGPESPDSRYSRYDSESDYDEIVEEDEDEGERLKYDNEAEELDDLYSNDYSDNDDDDNIQSFEKMDFDGSKYKVDKEETGFPSRTVNFSSYKQFPFRQQVNPKARLGQ